jgi:DNA modification methylase
MKIHCAHDELIDPKSLKQHPKNRNKHSKEQIDRLIKIIEYQGWRYPIKVSNRSGFITSGHGRLMAAMKMGLKEVPISKQDYDSDEQEYADVQSDNAIASWSELDLSGINLDIQDLGPDFDIDLLGIKGFEIDVADKEGEDDVPENIPATTTLGDLYVMGDHRLLCGDSTDILQVERLMNGEKADMVFTDPPYGMNLDTNYDGMYAFGDHTHTGNRFKKVEGDDKNYDPKPVLAIEAERKFIWGADYFYDRLPKGGCFIAWDKRSETLDRVPGNTTEFCWAYPPTRRTSVRIIWSGHYGMTGDDAGKRMHPTQNPIKLVEWFLDSWGKETKTVVDIYGGSGSTLIACEKTKRKCFMMELDPHYCDVIVARWEKYTGLKAELKREENVTHGK